MCQNFRKKVDREILSVEKKYSEKNIIDRIIILLTNGPCQSFHYFIDNANRFEFDSGDSLHF